MDWSGPRKEEGKILKLLKKHPRCPRDVSVKVETSGLQQLSVYVDCDLPEELVKTVVFLIVPVTVKTRLIHNGVVVGHASI